MRRASKAVLLLAVVALLALGLAACGGGDSASDTTASSSTPTTEEAPSTAPAGEGGANEESDAGGEDGGGGTPSSQEASQEKGSKSFVVPGGDNSIQNYGDEAESGELKAVEKMIDGFLDARAKGDWAKVCTYMSATALKPIEDLASKSPQLKGKGCAALLTMLSGSTPPAARVNTMTNGLASLREEGDRGFALYHGAKGVDYFLSVIKEDGTWKAASLAPTEVFGPTP